MNFKLVQMSCLRFVRLIHSGRHRASPLVDSIVRVDHAGELGADRIYAGQMAVLGNSKVGPVIQHMWDQEKVHKETFEKLIVKYRARPTMMVPIWNVAGFLLGAGTALMGEKAAMACTVAVEAVIVEHYNDQLRMLMDDPENNKELLETIQKFRDDEQEHHDSGLDHGAEQAPFYKGLTEVIKLGCKTAIAISKVSDYTEKRMQAKIGCRAYSTFTESQGENEKKNWDLLGSVCLERKALITRELNQFEKDYLRLLSATEEEKSFKSDHEMKKEEDRRRIETLKTDVVLNQAEMDLLSKQTAMEFEDAWNKELKSFQPESRKTEADERCDLKSVRRNCDRNLFLLIHSKKLKNWTMPETIIQKGETLRMTAERALREACGESLKVAFLSNAPCGFFKAKYPGSLKFPNIGPKIFFFKAIYLSGQIVLNENCNDDYRWATYSELKDLITSKKYLKSVTKFLIDDSDCSEEKLNNSQ